MTSQARLKILLSTSTIHFLFLYQKVFLDPKLLWIQKGLLLCSQVQIFLSPSLLFVSHHWTVKILSYTVTGQIMSRYGTIASESKIFLQRRKKINHFQVWHHPWIRTSRITWMDIKQDAFSTTNEFLFSFLFSITTKQQ